MATPRDAQDLCAIVAEAGARGEKLELRGGGSKADFGAPRDATVVSLQALSGVVDYDPAELVLTVRPGTPLADVQALVAGEGQMLAFEPWGGAGSTIGGTVAAGVAGSRRVTAGRLLNRCGHDVIFAPGEGCCGALVHHMGREGDARDAARRNVDAWMREIEGAGLDAILVTASGCGTTIKDYGFLLRDDPAYADKAAQVSALALDVSEYLDRLDLPAGDGRGLTVAYHPACSLQHGQKVTEAPKRLLARAGYTVRTPAEAHLCCGSAGTYNILQAELANQLGQRKADHLDALAADVVATGNIGCATQIARFSGVPVVHTVELLDWATGGPAPAALNYLPQE